MRRSLIPAAALVAAMAGSLVLAPVASASNGPKGDNGTVKIHESKTGQEIKANQPHVCEFYLDGFKFDSAQEISWVIDGHAPTAELEGTSGSLTLDASGNGRTEDITLPDGHYKLEWNFKGENGHAKQKTFWVDCEDETPGTETPGTGTPGTETPGTGTPGTETPVPSGTPGSSETPGGTGSPSATAPAGETGGTGGTGGDLAETGSSAPVGVLAAVAVALAGAGAFLVTRRRKAAQQG
ncbi:LPXTG cell wall anchor domain-containing protein [Streptomyces sp. NPDC057101]|uniref:LPXTG cell wall anchor domain-containing protein n=1 Tax=Streptomyces sp. NPDC057101 TaxID=3346020 RepID=UPI00362BCC1A